MLLLSDEYRRALQSKHWEKPTRPGDDAEKNFCFLMAVCNDCLRVCAFQAAAQEMGRDAGAALVSGEASPGAAVAAAFNGTADIAVRHLVRITFVDAQILLADFDEYWAVPAEQATKTLLATMGGLFQHLRPKLDERYVDKVTSACADVCVRRFLLLLKVCLSILILASRYEAEFTGMINNNYYNSQPNSSCCCSRTGPPGASASQPMRCGAMAAT